MKYVCISIHSTAQCKYWNYPNGWQEITDYLLQNGYKVVLISKEEDGYMGNYYPKGIIDKHGLNIENTMNILKHSEIHITISSGLSWLSWAMNIPTIIISGFTSPWFEPSQGIERVFNPNVCNSCFNDPNIEFDKGDWNWCPRKKDFECSKHITPEMIIRKINKIIFDKNIISTKSFYKKNIINEIIENNIYEKYFKVKDGDIVVDIGSHIGIFSTSCYDKKIKKIFCIEPYKENFKDLCKNIQYFGLKEKAILINKAIAKKTGEIFFNEDKKWMVGISSFNYSEYNDGNKIKIDTLYFLDFIKEYKINKINFLKIDCEGGEYDILEDNESFNFIKNNVEKMIVEFHITDFNKNNFLSLIKKMELNRFDIIINSLDGVNITDRLRIDTEYFTEVIVHAKNNNFIK